LPTRTNENLEGETAFFNGETQAGDTMLKGRALKESKPKEGRGY